MAATVRVVDFTNVKEQGNFNPRRKKEGDYYAHIVAVDDHTSKNDNEGWVFTIAVDGDARASYPYYCGSDEKQAWKIRGLFVAAGVDVPKKRLKIDPNKLLKKAIGISLEDDEYEGRPKSVIAGTIPVGDLSGALNAPGKAGKTQVDDEDDYEDDDEEETPPPAKKARKSKAKAKPAPVEDDEEDEDEEDDTPPPPKRRKAKKAPEPEPEDDEDEDDEEDEPEPPKRTKGKKAPAAKATKKKAAPADEDDEDDDLDLDEL
jgi:hypothetical protein